MRFALIGDHPDGLAAAQALAATGRHRLIAVFDLAAPKFAADAARHHDYEEILADPAVELVIVASRLTSRFEHLRRALQSDRPTLCVHPCAEKVERAYEASLIQNETKKLMLPLLPDVLHPAADALKPFRGATMLLQWEAPPHDRGFAGWPLLRHIGGEIVEVSAFAASPTWLPDRPTLLCGRFEHGGVFQATIRPAGAPVGERITLSMDGRHAQIVPTAAWRRVSIEVDGTPVADVSFDPWAMLAAEVEAQLAGQPARLTWQDAIRSMELADAFHTSLDKRRSIGLEFQEISADAGSKGTLTLIGCGIIWVMLLLLIVSLWEPWVRWAIVPLLVIILALIVVRWFAVERKGG